MQIYCRISSDEAKSGGNYAHFGVTGFDSRQPKTERDNDFKLKCENCNACVEKCPAKALQGNAWTPDSKREDIIDVEKCSDYMKSEFKMIGRGAVCGICIKNCPLFTCNK